jgi:hypothetical protein
VGSVLSWNIKAWIKILGFCDDRTSWGESKGMSREWEPGSNEAFQEDVEFRNFRRVLVANSWIYYGEIRSFERMYTRKIG